MTPAQQTTLLVIGALAWIGLALCLAVVIGLSIRQADQRRQSPSSGAPKPDIPSQAPYGGNRVHFHVTTTACDLNGCGLAGFHFHWRGRTHRSIDELSVMDAAELDSDCITDQRHRARLDVRL